MILDLHVILFWRFLNTDMNPFVPTGKTYRLRISNVGNALSLNFRIQNHKLLLVETEGSYTNQILLDSLDIHVGQSYSVLVTADQNEADYYMVASSKLNSNSTLGSLKGVGVLHYSNSNTPVTGPLPVGPNPHDIEFSINQAKSVRYYYMFIIHLFCITQCINCHILNFEIKNQNLYKTITLFIILLVSNNKTIYFIFLRQLAMLSSCYAL